MTIQQSLDIVDGSVTPSTDVLDTSLLEISSETNNLLQVKEAGTLYVRGVLKWLQSVQQKVNFSFQVL